jgi:prepilin-type N-terminal cleavage/methylation domain-containing protein
MKKLSKIKLNRGMTYVELIVVLSIFAALSSVILFNYGDFQAKVDIKNLASDIALKVVEAQKSSLNGVLPLAGYDPATWKPAYGVYFDISVPKQFIYFIDLDNSNSYNGLSSCTTTECLDKIIITKNNFISKIDKCTDATCTSPTSINSLSVAFSRPSSSAVFTGATVTGSEYVQITISSPKGVTALIKLYSSGRVQIN